jgi:hypothetical protein
LRHKKRAYTVIAIFVGGTCIEKSPAADEEDEKGKNGVGQRILRFELANLQNATVL